MGLSLRGTGALGAMVVGLAALGMSGCGADGDQEADLVAGKQEFVGKCGSCHVLARAETKGKTGPNLDDAFRQGVADGMGRDTVRSVVNDQILYPAKLEKNDPAYMPAKLVEGRAAINVAAYVAEVAGRGGKDSGVLATAVKAAGGGEPAVAKGGILSIPADPSGQLAYVTAEASSAPGALEIDSENASSVDHNIALEGAGINEVGPVVKDGGVSKISVTVAAGTYQFFCTVPGHREGGMEGELTVK